MSCGRRCTAIQYSDQKVCKRCALVWDMNDPDPPACLPEPKKVAPVDSNESARRRALARIKAMIW